MKEDMETNQQSPLWKMLCKGRGRDESPQCFCCEGEGAGRRAGFKQKGQGRENVLKVEGNTCTKAEG